MSEQNNTEMTFQIQRIYTKDISFEAPNAPHVFQKDWQPEVKLDLDTASTQLADDVYEVVLRVTVTASLGEETAFLCEVQQGGIFSIAGIEGTQMAHCLGAYCPNILFPYARECITSMVSRGTFPQLNLAPVNFDACERWHYIAQYLRTTLKGFLHMSEQNNTEMTFQIQRIYTKDISFEAPNAPHVFQKDWQPEVKLDLDTASTQLADDVYEVVLRVTVTASLGEETAFLCEVQQGGIFSIAGIEGTQMAHCLGAYCPNILFPYARECITSMVSRGTFPQLNLAPVNFDALFMNYLQQQAGEGTEEHQDA